MITYGHILLQGWYQVLSFGVFCLTPLVDESFFLLATTCSLLL